MVLQGRRAHCGKAPERCPERPVLSGRPAWDDTCSISARSYVVATSLVWELSTRPEASLTGPENLYLNFILTATGGQWLRQEMAGPRLDTRCGLEMEKASLVP